MPLYVPLKIMSRTTGSPSEGVKCDGDHVFYGTGGGYCNKNGLDGADHGGPFTGDGTYGPYNTHLDSTYWWFTGYKSGQSGLQLMYCEKNPSGAYTITVVVGYNCDALMVGNTANIYMARSNGSKVLRQVKGSSSAEKNSDANWGQSIFGMYADDTYLYASDSCIFTDSKPRVWRWAENAANYNVATATAFLLHTSNTAPRGITTDGANWYIVQGGTKDIYVYDLSFAYVKTLSLTDLTGNFQTSYKYSGGLSYSNKCLYCVVVNGANYDMFEIRVRQ